MIFFTQLNAGPPITQISPTFWGPDARVAGTSPPIQITLQSALIVQSIKFGDQLLTPPNFTQTNNVLFVPAGQLSVSAPGTAEVVINYANATTSDPNHPFDYFTYQGDWLVYVPDQSGVIFEFPINDNPFPPNIITSAPGSTMAVITSDGKLVYCTNAQLSNPAANGLTLIKTATQSASNVTWLSLGETGVLPLTIAVSPDSNRLVVADFDANRAYSVDISDKTSPALAGVYAVGSSPLGISFLPNSNAKAYVTNSGSNTISMLNILTPPMTNLYSDAFLNEPSWIAPVPVDASSLTFKNMVLCAGSMQALLYSEPIAPPPTTLGGPFSLSAPFIPQIFASPDSQTAFVPNTANSSVALIDIASNTQQEIDLSSAAVHNVHGMAIFPSGEAGICGAIEDTTLNEGIVVFQPSVTANPTFIDFSGATGIGYLAITPDQAPVARVQLSTSGLTATFDGSGSVSPTRNVVNWEWDFGDASPIVSGPNPVVMHTYAAAGSYLARLTVTNRAGTSTDQLYFGRMMYSNGGPQASLEFPVIFGGCNPALFPPACGVLKQRFVHCRYNISLKLFAPGGSEPIARYLVYADRNRKHLLTKVDFSGPVSKGSFISGCQLRCVYIFSQGFDGSVSCDNFQLCIKTICPPG